MERCYPRSYLAFFTHSSQHSVAAHLLPRLYPEAFGSAIQNSQRRRWVCACFFCIPVECIPSTPTFVRATPSVGDRVTVDWEGYTIGYYGRPFQTRNKVCARMRMRLYLVSYCCLLLRSKEGPSSPRRRTISGESTTMPPSCRANLSTYLLKLVTCCGCRWVVGSGSVVAALDEAVQYLKEGGVMQVIVPAELGYPVGGDSEHDLVGPK